MIGAGFDYYRTTAKQADKEKIKEALTDGRATKPSDYDIKDILDNAPSKYKTNITQAIKDLVQEYANTSINALPKTNGAIEQKANTTEIEKRLGIESKKKFDSKKAYSPIELIESFKEYQSYLTIQLAFRHSAISLAQGANYEIPYSTESNKAFILIAQAIANHIVNKRSDKKAQIQTWVNKVYADENRSDSNKLGNTQQGDGYNFKGRGIIQITGRSNYTSFQSYYNKHNPNDTKDFLNNEEHRKELTTNGKIALLSAVWFWNDKKCSPNTKKYPELLMFKGKHLYEIADDEINGNVATTKENVKTIKSVLAISVSVNGGTNGLSDRAKQHTRIKSQNIFKDF